MNRIEVNVTTGERKVIELTPEEVADALARTAEEAAKPPPARTLSAERLAELFIAKGALTVAEVDTARTRERMT